MKKWQEEAPIWISVVGVTVVAPCVIVTVAAALQGHWP
jgi:hypothetical protein